MIYKPILLHRSDTTLSVGSNRAASILCDFNIFNEFIFVNNKIINIWNANHCRITGVTSY